MDEHIILYLFELQFIFHRKPNILFFNAFIILRIIIIYVSPVPSLIKKTLPPKKQCSFSHAVFNAIERIPVAVVAAINGFALGGGCELALACDFRFASDNAKFGQPEVNYGIIPGFGGSQRLARLIGTGEAKEMIYTGSMIDAEEALRIGLINRITTQENLIPECEAILRKIMSKAPMAIASAKNAINTGMNMDLRSGLAYEAQVFGSCFATRDQKEGMAAFLEKRKPVFTNR